jgi:Phage integrase, N-terminal SAM-like domain
MVGPRRRRGRGAQPDAGPLGADIASFRLHLAAEGKAPRTVQGYTGAVRWFAAAYLLGQAGKTSWEQADGHDVRQWMVQLLDRYSDAYASIQFRALRQFFKWLAAEDEIPDPMDRLRARRVAVREVPVFTSVELSALEKACRGSTFAARRDAAIIAVFQATGIFYRRSDRAHPCGRRPGPRDHHRRQRQARRQQVRPAAPHRHAHAPALRRAPGPALSCAAI